MEPADTCRDPFPLTAEGTAGFSIPGRNLSILTHARVLPPGDHSHRGPEEVSTAVLPLDEPCSPGQGHCCLAWPPRTPSRWAADEARRPEPGALQLLASASPPPTPLPSQPRCPLGVCATGLWSSRRSWQLSEPAEESRCVFKINSILKSPSFHSKPGKRQKRTREDPGPAAA